MSLECQILLDAGLSDSTAKYYISDNGRDFVIEVAQNEKLIEALDTINLKGLATTIPLAQRAVNSTGTPELKVQDFTIYPAPRNKTVRNGIHSYVFIYAPKQP
ncbi:hypothetical protein [Shewanella mangrovisoli]|uniref:hypothetical protein n=1 Tax=Shewanella mangrovisoli TaxID=2864211 RepID=UPI001C6596BE|nr:hypothetical protein [Shewanella mangrovisoli]QYK10007.1 hypothetical protein K0H60_04680 [Shewanella mangrovisoli]